MGVAKGSKIIIKKGSAVICAGITSKEITFNGEAIDISDDDSDGWRELHTEPGELSLDISFEGLEKDSVLRTTAATANRMLTAVTVVFPDLGEYEGNFYLGSYKVKGEKNEAITFSAEIQSSGKIEYTAPA